MCIRDRYQVIKGLIKHAKQVNITITVDNLEQTLNPDTDIFYANKITVKKLQDLSLIHILLIVIT